MKKALLVLLIVFLSGKSLFAQSGYIDLVGIYEDEFTYLQPPAQFSAGLRTATFNITFTSYTGEAQAAFQYASDIWASILISNIPIKVNTYFIPLTPGLLGITLPNARKNFPAAPVANTWYASCLANALSDSELNVGEYDVDLFLNSSIGWYFGTDGNCPAGKFDFVSIVLHELCHGLGFVGLGKSENNLGSFGHIDAQDFFPIVTSFPFLSLEGKPGIFDHFLVNTFDEALTDSLLFPNNSAILDVQFTSSSVYFNGLNAVSVNNGTEPRIYAPGNFSLGSSLLHLNESTYPAGNPNELMTPFSGTAEAIHNPGQIAVGMLMDIGWKVNYNVGVEEATGMGTEVRVFPNPVSDQLTLSHSSQAIDLIEISDLAGRKIIVKRNPTFPLDVSELPDGLYLLTVEINHISERTAFIKAKS